MSSNNNSNAVDPFEQGGGNVTEDGDTVSVGPDAAENAKNRARNSGTQMDRIEAKLDYLIAQEGDDS